MEPDNNLNNSENEKQLKQAVQTIKYFMKKSNRYKLFRIAKLRKKQLDDEKVKLVDIISKLIDDIQNDTNKKRWWSGVGVDSSNEKILLLQRIKESLEKDSLFNRENTRVAYFILLRSVCNMHRHSFTWFVNYCFYRFQPASLAYFDDLVKTQFPKLSFKIHSVDLNWKQRSWLLQGRLLDVLHSLSTSRACLLAIPVEKRTPKDRLEDCLEYVIDRMRHRIDRSNLGCDSSKYNTKLNNLESILKEIRDLKSPQISDLKPLANRVKQVCSEPRNPYVFWPQEGIITRSYNDWLTALNHFFSQESTELGKLFEFSKHP